MKTQAEIFALATQFASDAHDALENMDAAQRMTDILNSLTHKETGTLALILASKLSLLEKAIATKFTPGSSAN